MRACRVHTLTRRSLRRREPIFSRLHFDSTLVNIDCLPARLASSKVSELRAPIMAVDLWTTHEDPMPHGRRKKNQNFRRFRQKITPRFRRLLLEYSWSY